MTPKQARTNEQICDLPRDNVSAPGFWFRVDEDVVCIGAQEWGEPATAVMHIPREIFEAFAAWYQTGRFPKKLAKQSEVLRLVAVAGEVR